MRLRAACAALLLLVCAVSPLTAQATDSSRVRVTTRNGWQVVGTLLATRDDSVSVRQEGLSDVTTIAFDSISTFEVSQGMQRHVGRGFLIGAGSGAVLGAALGVALHSPCRCDINFSRGFDAALGGVLGGLAGGAVGMMIGAERHEAWRAVPLARRHAANLLPSFNAGRVGMVASFRF